jgi:hypothetical protein
MEVSMYMYVYVMYGRNGYIHDAKKKPDLLCSSFLSYF